MKFGIYGTSGYLGSLVLKNFENSIPLNRDCFSNTNLVVDCSFPQNYLNQAVANKYIEQIDSRSKYYQEKKIKYIYIGSYSSVTPINSVYGRIKQTAEKVVFVNGGTVLKCGLVTSIQNPQGRFGQLFSLIQKLPFLILPSKETFGLHITREEDFLDSLQSEVLYKSNGIFLLEATKTSDLNTLVSNLALKNRTFHLSYLFSSVFQKLVHLLPTRYFDNLKSIANWRHIEQHEYIIIPKA